jgi:pilus assembly protein Flp/PilA
MVDFLIRQYVALQNLLVVDRDEEGQGLAEYALILALIAIVAIVALTLLGGQIRDILDEIANAI